MNSFLNFFNKKYFFTLTGLLFFLSITLEPLLHDHDHNELGNEKEIELSCELCSFDVFDDILYTVKKEINYFSKSLSIEDFDITFNDNLYNFNPRAPPKI